MSVMILQMPYFKKAYKKLHDNRKKAVNEAIETISKNPLIGEEKKGDLADVRVYKFRCVNQLYLLAYELDEETRLLLALGVHEKFYEGLQDNL